MSEWKEAWYAWSGFGYEPDLESVAAIMDRHGNITLGPFKYISWIKPKGGWFNYVDAYTLGEKRRRVECPDCGGFYFWVGSKGFEECAHCSKGYKWEYKK